VYYSTVPVKSLDTFLLVWMGIVFGIHSINRIYKRFTMITQMW